MKRFMFVSLIALLMVVLAACGGDKDSESSSSNNSEDTAQANEDTSEESETRTIEYLGEAYTVPKTVEKVVVTGAMEAMEDATVLDVNLTGAISVGGEFPEIYAAATEEAESIGEKQQPNFEKILELKPDVILGTTKFPEEVQEKLQKIAPTILVSHISTNWEANLKLMAELTGKQADAETILSEYESDMATAEESLTEKLQGKKVAAIRVRGGQVFVYPEGVFFNPVLYDELGLEVPDEVKKAKTQEAISVEQLADMNPDYLFVQFSTSENEENETAFEEMKKNSIVQNINAFKNDHVFVNVVDPLMEGGPAYSRIEFLKNVQEHLEK
ncbi:MAG: ABC transporter substrate-binding protein [Bacillota bacterium]|uniref:ABC transporter substrate-binding protein n=1 Tax=Virgibacillus salarius TaxID=447199 RepID=A0A941DW05_9BACI|nr:MULTISPECIES: ABC transporter substrate-binding protein [Bacillaceae]NAZ07235.1 ABC transporter substrate-binding protein [Agaribacter marinus]MBR7794513.1 ABC transporter substrate-binding protein [Virgibacillus salarius]MCC2249498.1 ABC transporter substrate-binding protein [Virgibacillus sp. AGTR]MDY7043304.1 ABC transporter substrate-binding protein [Virgibacillus sp. M23]QRZ17863.1 ABC transporter substrate-binding protein [Virgibacillus sp. AGTR]